jgi:ribosomal protein S18 acetylase RimI-like enzyme
MLKKRIYLKGVGFIITAALIALGVQYLTLQNRSLSWFEFVVANTAQTGKRTAVDKQNLPINIVWQRTSLQSPDHFTDITKSVGDIAVQAYTTVETNFLRQYPKAVLEDEYLQSFKPLFADGIEHVDWSLVEDQQRAKLKSIFEMDLTSLAPEVIASLPKDIYFFVMAYDATTSKLLGFIQFAVAPYYTAGDVKVITIAVAPEEQNRGLGKLLMSSVFEIIPNVQRIFLSTRPTNQVAISAYQAWGFTPDAHPVQDPSWKAVAGHWIYFEYLVNQTCILQKTAELLKTEWK